MRKEPRNEKIGLVENLKSKIEAAKILILTKPRGLTVKQVTDLKKRLRAEGAEYTVVKNTLTQRAFSLIGIEKLKEYLTEEVAILFGKGDVVTATKILTKFVEENEKPEIKLGVMDGEVIPKEGIERLAKLPSRQILLAQVVSQIAAPLTRLVGTLQGPIRSLVYAIDAIRKDKDNNKVEA